MGLCRRIVLVLLLAILPVTAQAKHKHPESWYQKEWCKNKTGQAEYILPDRTRCDCLTEAHAIEFDFAVKFYEAIGQSLYYSMLTGKLPGIVLIMESPNDQKYIDRAKRIINHWGLPVAVWVISYSEGFPPY